MLVYVLRISTPHADNISVFQCQDDAIMALHDYVVGEWDEGLADQFGPCEDHSCKALIDLYFETMDTALDPEFYTLTETTLRLSLETYDRPSCAASEILAMLRLALRALNTAPRFRVDDTDSYAIASQIQRLINTTNAKE